MTSLTHLHPADPIDELCDVYVGPAIRTPERKITRIRSRWYTERYGADDKIMRRYIRRRFGAHLQSLRGKTLGCTCSSPDTCTGHILVDLCNRLSSGDEGIGIRAQPDAVFFMGRACPLSNLYPNESLMHRGRKFENAYNLYRWLKMEHAEPGKDGSLQQHIVSMYKALLQKWEQCDSFRQLARRYSERVLLEATRDTFWGCGMDYWKLSKSVALDRIGGRNILGWLIKIICSVRDGFFCWRFSCRQLSHSLVRGLRLCTETLADAQLVDGGTVQKLRNLAGASKKKKKKKLFY